MAQATDDVTAAGSQGSTPAGQDNTNLIRSRNVELKASPALHPAGGKPTANERRRAARAVERGFRAAVREGAWQHGVLWVRNVCNLFGVVRLRDLKGDALRITASVLVQFCSQDVLPAFALLKADAIR